MSFRDFCDFAGDDRGDDFVEAARIVLLLLGDLCTVFFVLFRSPRLIGMSLLRRRNFVHGWSSSSSSEITTVDRLCRFAGRELEAMIH